MRYGMGFTGRPPVTIRDLEAASIRAFVQDCADKGYLSGRVLDYGAGDQRYGDIVREAGGEYAPYDRVAFPGSCAAEDVGPEHPLWCGLRVDPYDAILCTQVIQYVLDFYNPRVSEFVSGAVDLVSEFYNALNPLGRLLMTGPQNWPTVESTDLRRYTPDGVRHLLDLGGFSEYTVEERAHFVSEGERWCVGWQAVARA